MAVFNCGEYSLNRTCMCSSFYSINSNAQCKRDDSLQLTMMVDICPASKRVQDAISVCQLMDIFIFPVDCWQWQTPAHPL